MRSMRLMSRREASVRRHVGLAVAAFVLVCASGGSALAVANAAEQRWRPRPGTTWQWQLSGKLDTSVRAAAYDIDLFDNSRRVVRGLKRRGRAVICYLSAGSWERWRPDAGRFPPRVKGRSNGWPGERWLDIRRLRVLKPIMRARLDRCERKGFDGVEFDNVDGYDNRTGFTLTGRDQLVYNRWLAHAAHVRGLSAGLKNDVGQVQGLHRRFDFAINEECFYYHECWRLRPFIRAHKAVFHVEYEVRRPRFCPRTTALGFSSMRKGWNLGRWRRTCW
jgi:hypothetical protein